MQPKWLIESNCFKDDKSLKDALKRQNIEFKTIKYEPLESGKDYFNLFTPDDCVIFHGSLNFARQIRRESKWIPGVFYDIPKYDCTNYYPPLGDLLLNENYIMLPYGELSRRKEYLYEHLSFDNAIFLRPNSGGKTFTGKVIYKENYDKEVDLIGVFNLAPETLVVVAEPINLATEWRFVVGKSDVIAGSQYRKGQSIWRDDVYPQEASDFAELVSKKYQPEGVWVVDVCLTKGGEYKVVEIGCFSCAGLYECNRDEIVKQVSEIALKEWEEYNESV